MVFKDFNPLHITTRVAGVFNLLSDLFQGEFTDLLPFS